jgi:WD40 repeat protein
VLTLLHTGSWEDGYRATTGQAVRGPALFICFTSDSDAPQAGKTVMTGGAGYVRFWSLGTTLTSTATSLPGTAVLCGAPVFCKSDRAAVTGCANGDVLVWQSGECKNTAAAAHAGAVYSVAECWVSGNVVTGSADGVLKVWDMYTLWRYFSNEVSPRLEAAVPGGAAVTAVAAATDGSKVAVKTASGALLELLLDSAELCCLVPGAVDKMAGMLDGSASAITVQSAVGA